MSEIRFVTALGDAFEDALVRTSRRRARARRRVVAVAAATLCFAGGGVAVARLLANPEQLAAGSVACYDGDNVDGAMTVPDGALDPLAACAQVYRQAGEAVPPQVACAGDSGVVLVFRRSGARQCRRLGFAPLPAGYGADRAKVQRLQRAIFALEGRADCTSPALLAQRVDALLRRTGWTGWRAAVRLRPANGPCGTVSQLGGGLDRSIAGRLDAIHRLVLVVSAPHRSTERLLYSDAGHTGLAVRLEDASRATCLAPDTWQAEVLRSVPSDRVTRFIVTAAPTGLDLDAATARYQAGCVVISDVSPASDGLGLVVSAWHRP